MTYRREIDGLRAIAVLPVFLFHAGFELFGGGFVGVDIFFVISGYLITGIIFDKIRDRSFSILGFYERRIRRILPALFVVIIASVPFAWLWMLPDDFKSYSHSLISVNLFYSNIMFWKEAGYFTAASEIKPLLHTWSLAVEEQFYVIYPLFLLLFRKLEPKALLTLLFILVIASLGLAEWASRSAPIANFYLLPTRAWELGIGAILAIGIAERNRPSKWLSQSASAVGLFMIIYSILVFDGSIPFPSVRTLVPTIGTALIIVFANPQTLVGTILAWRPVAGIGLISYSAYLWHFPLFAFARIRSLDVVAPSTFLYLSVLALALAYLSWRFVERPFRRKTTFTRRQIVGGASIFSTFLIVIGYLGYAGEGLPKRLPPEVGKMAAWADDRNPRIEECSSGPRKHIPPANACFYGTTTLPHIAILGDSHAAALASELSSALTRERQGLQEFSYSGCPPTIGISNIKSDRGCSKYFSTVQNFILENQNTSTVILLARWTIYIEGQRFDNGDGGIERGVTDYMLPTDTGMDFTSASSRKNAVGRLIRESVRNYLNNGKRVVLVYPVPEVGWNVPKFLAKTILFHNTASPSLSTDYTVFKARTKDTRRQLDMLEEHRNLIRIRPDHLFCNTFIPDRCVATLDKTPLYFDDNHLNSIGSIMLSDAIVKSMKERGWLQ